MLIDGGQPHIFEYGSEAVLDVALDFVVEAMDEGGQSVSDLVHSVPLFFLVSSDDVESREIGFD
jgi:hypothetical protein